MTHISPTLLKPYASKYMWWKAPEDSVRDPLRVVAQVMNIGDYDDVQQLAGQLGDEPFEMALVHAQAGQFNARSWAYWHYRLGLAAPGQLPSLPQRPLPSS